MNKKITVYCASSSNVDRVYLDKTYDFGAGLALNNFEIIYGGGNVGLMGQLADGALSKGGIVTGVITDFLMELELGHLGIYKLIKTKDLHERQRIMMNSADVIVALPGGCGTFVELFEAITWKKLGRIICPILIVNINGYFDDLIKMLNKAIDEGFMRKEHYNLWNIVDDIDSAIIFLNKDYNFIHYDIV
jgi:uncharacterized protein (TIGR00730 family)